MRGKTVLITGGNSGIGRTTGAVLAARGARVVLACRSIAQADAVAREIASDTGNEDVKARELDLASLASVRRFADAFLSEYDRLDVLINNAGVFPGELRKTEDGFEEQFGVNHLGHFLLTNLLRARLEQNASARVVHVSSMMHARGKIDFESFRGDKPYSMWTAYGQSKLCNILFSNELSRRLAGTGVTSNSLHPGSVTTNITRTASLPLRMLTKLFFRSPEKGAETSVYLASDPSVDGVTGKYFVGRSEKQPADAALDEELQRRLWEESAKLCGITAP